MIHEVMKMREEEKKQSSRKLGIKRFFKKRWVYPAIYIGAGAILLSTFLWFQARDNEGAKENEFGYESNSGRDLTGEDALEVNSPVEDFEWPVADKNVVEVVTNFYDPAATEKNKNLQSSVTEIVFIRAQGLRLPEKTVKHSMFKLPWVVKLNLSRKMHFLAMSLPLNMPKISKRSINPLKMSLSNRVTK